MALHVYPSDLTDAEWEAISPRIPPAKSGGWPPLSGDASYRQRCVLSLAEWLRLALRAM